MRSEALLAPSLAFLSFFPPGIGAEILLTREQAVQRAFPEGASFKKKTAFLSDEQLEAARERAGRGPRIDSRIWTYYASTDPASGLFAYFDRAVVRDQPTVFMAVVDAGGTLRSIEVLAFRGPAERAATPGFLRQFHGIRLTRELRLGGDVDGISGATYTSTALVESARRILAVHSVLHPRVN